MKKRPSLEERILVRQRVATRFNSCNAFNRGLERGLLKLALYICNQRDPAARQCSWPHKDVTARCRMSRSGTSHTSSSDSDDGSAGHPIDAALRRRTLADSAGGGSQAAQAQRQQPSPGSASPPESGEVSAGTPAAEDLQDARTSRQAAPSRGRTQSAGNCTTAAELRGGVATAGGQPNSEVDLDAVLASGCSGSSSSGSEAEQIEPAVPQAPTGVILVESMEERNAEVQRLLRAPR